MNDTPPWQDRVAAIHAHLDRGGVVQVVTYTKAWLYTAQHRAWFSADDTGLYVRHGRGRVCLNYTPIRFGRYADTGPTNSTEERHTDAHRPCP
jgi:hypothetical protein